MRRPHLWFLALSACSVPAALCDVPSATTYSCQPLPAGARGCEGGPVWRPERSDAGDQHQDDLGLVFPPTCHARIPDCSEYQRGRLRGFECIDPGGAELPSWAEGL